MPRVLIDSLGDESQVPPWLEALEQADSSADERNKRHFAESHISAWQHSHDRRMTLGKMAMSKHRVYLDQKYWIYCRDAMLGRPQKPIHMDIWDCLRALVRDGHVVCPVTYPILSETFRQRDLTKRRNTAMVIDRLSQGVAIQPFPDLIQIELHHLLVSQSMGIDTVDRLPNLVWTYAGFVVGELILHSLAFDNADNNAIQKCFFDAIANAPFSSLVDATAGADIPGVKDDETYYSRLNSDCEQFRHEVTSFDAVFRSEVAGFLDGIQGEIIDVLTRMFTTATDQPAFVPTPSEAAESARLTRNLIYNLYRLRKVSTEFPSLHIRCGLHAAARHRQQPFKKGDSMDYMHAHAALGYCNAFLTEKNLGSLLSSPPLAYDKAYSCRVIWTDEDVIEYLRALSICASP